MAPNVTARHSRASPSAPTGTLAERYDRGVGLRQKNPRKKHADLLGPTDRDPVAILARGDRTRVPELVPVRYERMLTSPFGFLRGAAAVARARLLENFAANAATATLAVNLLRSTVKSTPGSVSSKSLMSKRMFSSGVAKAPKFIRWQSPHAWTAIPEAG